MGKTLALVRRALRVDVRHARSHLFRAALAGIILFMLFSIHDQQLTLSAPGLTLFSEIAFANYWFITLAGATFFASAITEEKEERTLSLLKMANIGPLSMLLGKWTPRLLAAVFLIGIQMPFMTLATTLGGILWNQIGAVYLALLAHLFLMGNLGLLASVLMPRTGSACGLFLILLILLQGVPPALAEILREQFLNQSRPLDLLIQGLDGLTAMNALLSISDAMQTGYQGSVLAYQLISSLIAGGLLFGLAWALFDRCTASDSEPEAESVWLRKLRRWGRRRETGRVWDLPIVWKDFEYLGGGGRLQIIKFLCYGLLVVGLEFLLADGKLSQMEGERLGGVAIFASLFQIVAEASLMASRVYRVEITQQTWSTLVLLPRSLAEVAYPKLGGCLLSLLPAVIWLGIGCLLCLDNLLRFFGEIVDEPEALLGISYFLMQLLLGMHLAVWFSVSMKWAIWPLAIATAGFIVFTGNMMLMSCLVGAGGNGVVGLLAFLTASGGGLTLWVHALIGRRLRAAAAE